MANCSMPRSFWLFLLPFLAGQTNQAATTTRPPSWARRFLSQNTKLLQRAWLQQGSRLVGNSSRCISSPLQFTPTRADAFFRKEGVYTVLWAMMRQRTLKAICTFEQQQTCVNKLDNSPLQCYDRLNLAGQQGLKSLHVAKLHTLPSTAIPYTLNPKLPFLHQP